MNIQEKILIKMLVSDENSVRRVQEGLKKKVWKDSIETLDKILIRGLEQFIWDSWNDSDGNPGKAWMDSDKNLEKVLMRILKSFSWESLWNFDENRDDSDETLESIQIRLRRWFWRSESFRDFWQKSWRIFEDKTKIFEDSNGH